MTTHTFKYTHQRQRVAYIGFSSRQAITRKWAHILRLLSVIKAVDKMGETLDT